VPRDGTESNLMAIPQWYVRAQGQVTGPYDLGTMILFREQGLLLSHYEVSEDRRTWVPAAALDELFLGSNIPGGVPPAAIPPPIPVVPPPTACRDEPEKGEAGHATLGQGPFTEGGEADAPPPRSLPNPFGRYRILKEIGKGAMGTVYLAHDD